MTLSLKLVRRGALVAVAASSLFLAACGDDSASNADSVKTETTAKAGAASGATTSIDLGSLAAGLTTGKATEAGKKFCQTMSDFDSIDSDNDDLATTKKNMIALADQIKANAPSEIKKAADSYADLIKSAPDVLASTANYLKGYGWKAGQPYNEGSENFEILREWNRAEPASTGQRLHIW